MADSKEKLFSDFPPVSTQEWMDKITVDLKGADFEKKLVWKTQRRILKVKTVLPPGRSGRIENDRRTSRNNSLTSAETAKTTIHGLSGRTSG